MGSDLAVRPRGRSITAAAKRLPIRTPDGALRPGGRARTADSWSTEAWSYFDTVPEVKFAARFLGNCVSRLRFYPAIVLDPDQPPVPLALAVGEQGVTAELAAAADEEMARLDSGDGRPALQKETAIQLTIAGESNLVGREIDGEEVWQAYSDAALTRANDSLAIRDTPGAQPVELGPDDFVARLWRRHSQWPGLADSNMRAVLDVCEELLIYGRQFRAVGRSRNNAGVLLLPNELDFANVRVDVPVDDEDEPEPDPPAVVEAESDEDELTPLERGIVDSLVTPTADDGSASQVVPHLLRGPAAALAEVRHVPLDRKIDEQAIARIVHLISRLATGIDVPVEVLTGIADANHWTGWLIEDTTYKAHVEPLAGIPAAGWAQVFLRPALLARPDDFDPAVVKRVVLGIDPSALVVRPNRGVDARDAFDRKAISWDALRDYLGMSDADAPSSDELLLRYTLDRSIGGMSLTRDLFDLLGPPYDAVPDAAEAAASETEAKVEAEAEAAPPSPNGSTPPTAPPQEGGEPTPANEGEASMRRLVQTLTAASSASSQIGERLAAIDARLRDRIQLAASDALTAALDTAGKRLRAQVQGDPELAELVRGVPNEDVGAALAGQQPVTAESVLPPSDFAQLAERWSAWVADARREAIELVRRDAAAHDVDGLDQTLSDELGTAQDDDDAGWALLLAALLLLGRSRVFTPNGTPDDGEFDPHIAVPAGLVRDALARAGGQLGGTSSIGVVGGGPASGVRMIRVLARAGAVQVAWRWDVGMPSVPFPPHQALSGLVFTSFDSPELAHLSAFPPGGHYFPGDHRGCQCDAVPILVWEGTTTPVPGGRDFSEPRPERLAGVPSSA